MKKIMVLMIILEQLVLAHDYIEVYSAYSNGKRVLVKGRIIDTKDKKTKSSKLFSAFFNDEKKDVAITLRINKESYLGKSDSEGYFLFDINVKNRLNRTQNVILETEDEASQKKIPLFQPSLKAHVGVISDFDDTVIVSDVTQKTKLLYNTFFKNFKEREIISEIEKSIKKIVYNNKLKDKTALFFISGSPHQFNNNINNFLDFHHFPERTVLTKKIHGEGRDSLQASIAYKYDKIVRLIEMYPDVKWVFFGDSGEKDSEIYLKVMSHYPDKIKKVYIRDVKSKKVKLLKNEIS